MGNERQKRLDSPTDGFGIRTLALAIGLLSGIFPSCDPSGGSSRTSGPADSAAVFDPYVLLRSDSDTSRYLRALDLKTGESIRILYPVRSASLPKPQLQGSLTAFFQKVIAAGIVNGYRDSLGLIAGYFVIHSVLRDTAIAGNPHPDSLDDLMHLGGPVGDFAPIRKGNSWTYLDTSLSCQTGKWTHTVSCEILKVATRTVTIEDVFAENDTTFFRIRDAGDSAVLCFERGSDIFSVPSDMGGPRSAEPGCAPLVRHTIAYEDTAWWRFAKIDTLGTRSLAYRFPDEFQSEWNGGLSNIGSVRAVRGVGTLGYERVVPFSGSDYFNITRSVLLQARLQ